MEHHVYAVWDFMSLVKSLQHHICPSGNLWLPTPQQRKLSRLINEIVLAEESDTSIDGNTNTSHFDLYLQAMTEIGADTKPVLDFIELVRKQGIDRALDTASLPAPSRQFMRSTFGFLKNQKPHITAAVFAYGRETVIPAMFKRISNQLGIVDATRFNYYLNRHIEVDGEEHGPSSLELVNFLCDYDPIKLVEAESAAVSAIQSRIEFWNAVESRILSDD